MKIAAIVITHNRKQLLSRCLDAIEAQTRRPDVVYVVDNASTDGTADFLKSRQEAIPMEIISIPENMGGSGGFYTGIKAAHQAGLYDYFWIMDDDGVPADDCLEQLLTMAPYHHIAPLVVDTDNPDQLAFPNWHIRKGMTTVKQVEDVYGPDGIILDHENPFNGILLSDKLLREVGYPNKDFFIWGDETDFYLRTFRAKLAPLTVVKARHHHPKDRTVLYKDYRGHECLLYVDSPLRRYCYYRNYSYIYHSQNHTSRVWRLTFAYTLFYLFNRKMDLRGLGLYWRAMIHGLRGDFSHTKDYLN